MENRGSPSIIETKCNPSRHYLVAKLRDYRSRLDVYEARCGEVKEKMQIVASCKSHLDDIETMLGKGSFFRFINTFSIWHLFHRVDENFYLFMERSELKAYAWELTQALKLSPIPQTTKADWFSRLQEVLKKLEGTDGGSTVEDAAIMIKAAAYVNNDCVDNLFWDYWCRKFFVLIYTVSLLIILLFAFLFSHFNGSFAFCNWTACILGAMGGLGSGILSAQIENVPYGQFWTNVSCYALARPLQGALAALMVFWMLQSQYMIKIEPPLSPGQVAFTCKSSARIELPVAGTSPTKSAPFRNTSSAKQDPLVILKAAPGMQVYLYMLVLLIAGFSGDKLLRYISGKVTNKLFADAEKSKEGK